LTDPGPLKRLVGLYPYQPAIAKCDAPRARQSSGSSLFRAPVRLAAVTLSVDGKVVFDEWKACAPRPPKRRSRDAGLQPFGNTRLGSTRRRNYKA